MPTWGGKLRKRQNDNPAAGFRQLFEQVVNIGPDEPDVGKEGIKEDTVFLSYFNQSNRIFNFGNKQRFGQICIAEHYFELLWRFINTAKSPDIFD